MLTINIKEKNSNVALHIYQPNDCPLCHTKINPPIQVHQTSATDDKISVVFMCNNQKCFQYFIAQYKIKRDENRLIGDLTSLRPKTYKIKDFSNNISEISQEFMLIYKQAWEAKERELYNIAGPGFRKAFEFLIKDYAKYKAPNSAKEIEGSYSGTVVKKYIENERIQKVAERALWLGNDETHYLRKWEDKDLNDLLNLIDLTINWIEIEKLSAEYIEDMPDKKNISSKSEG